MRILVIEDDPQELSDLKDLLRQDYDDVLTATDGKTGLRLARQKRPDLIILDWELPDIHGDKICITLRQENHPAMILMLTGRRTEAMHEFLALQMQADEYVRKPYNSFVLMERIRKMFRRRDSDAAAPDAVYFDDVAVDFLAYEARKADTCITMSYRDFDILRHLVARAGTVVTRNDLIEEFWGLDSDVTARQVDNTILRLRQKLERDPSRPIRLLTTPKVGYKFAKAPDIFVTIHGQKARITK